MGRATQQAVILQDRQDWGPLLRVVRKVLILVVVLGAVFMLVQTLSRPDLLPINRIKAQGSFTHVTEAMLQTALGTIDAGYFSVNVKQIQQQVEALPWVDKAVVRRVWPDVLAIRIVEQEPVALWKSGGLVNKRGELFYPAEQSYPSRLPVLSGPEGASKQLLSNFIAVREALLQVNLQTVRVDMDARRALTVWLNNGTKLVLGRNEAMQRLQRFVRIYPGVLAIEGDNIERVDMRYTNGFTIKRK
ncbi:MAG: cell division protein FtsQ/DivIB [Gammaproteobacteria bacterium]|nr:cell division protein FtsQ/DivIB [Gammaproteobacteria bacterium]